MKLTKLIIENYRQFTKQELVFEQGLNFVFGNNEAGKSTVSRALLDVLFESPEKTNKTTKAMQSWQSNNKARLELEFIQGEKSYRLIKDWQTKSSEIFITEAGKKTSQKGNAEVEAVLKKLLPFYSREIYEDTAFISADSIMSIHNDPTGFKNALQNAVVGGGSVAVNSILTDLEKQIKELNAGMERRVVRPGMQRQLIDKIAELEGSLVQAKTDLAKLNSAQLELQTIKSKLDEALTFISTSDDIISKNKRAQEIDEALLKVGKTFEQTQQEIESRGMLKTEINSVNESISRLPDIDWQRLEQDIAKAKGVNEMLSAFQDKEEGQEFNKTTKTSINFVRSLLPIIAFVVFGLILSFAIQTFIPVLVAVVLAAIFAFAKYKPKGKQVSDVANSVLQNLLIERKAFKDKYADYSLTELEQLLKDYSKLQNEKEKYLNQLEILNASKSIEQLELDRKQIIKEELKLNEELDKLDFKQTKISAQEYSKLSRELAETKESVATLEAKRTEYEFIIKHTEIDNERVTTIEEQLDFTRNELVKVQQRLKVLELTKEGLNQAISATANDASALVEQEIAKYLPLITANRYHKARLNQDLSLDVYSQSKQDWCACEVSTTELSRGTVDQIYLITRLAFIKLLTGQKKLPIILDDPLLTFDANRKAEAKKLLQEFAKEFQIIFFTFDGSISAQTILG